MPKKDKLFNELEQIHLEQQQRAGSKAHPVVSDAEKEKRKAEGKTRGAKGAKMDRINMAFYTDNFEYLRIMSKIKGHFVMTSSQSTERRTPIYSKRHAKL